MADSFTFRIPRNKTVHRGTWKHGVGGGGRIQTDCGRIIWPVNVVDVPLVKATVTFGEPPTCKRCLVVATSQGSCSEDATA